MNETEKTLTETAAELIAEALQNLEDSDEGAEPRGMLKAALKLLGKAVK